MTNHIIFPYEPFDGDFESEQGDELARLANDLLGNQFVEAVEIALSLHGSEGTDPTRIRVEVNEDEETEGWDYDRFLDIPEGWTYEQVARILADGYTVYFQPT